MAISRRNGYRQQVSVWKRLVDRLNRYDLLLVAIPLVFVLPMGAHATLSVPFHATLAAGAVLSATFVFDALFLHPPTARRSG